jgi:hypothetical protein
VSSDSNQARLIAERVARRLAGDKARRPASTSNAETEPKSEPDPPRARMIDFISSGPPLRSVSAVSQPLTVTRASEPVESAPQTEFFQFVPVAQSPWLGRLPGMLAGASPQPAVHNAQPAEHSSQERFGVEEATVAELVEFFENEKQCSMDPSGKPCDHCAMCSSRGF